jgi:hypothetical protein
MNISEKKHKNKYNLIHNLFMNKKLKIKFAIAVIAVICSLVLGAYTKVMMILNFGNPFKFWLNLVLYVMSWLMLFVAAFFVGKEVVKLADNYVKRKMQETYDTTKKIQRRGREGVASITRRGYDFTRTHLTKTAKHGIKKTKQFRKKTIKMHKEFLKI